MKRVVVVGGGHGAAEAVIALRQKGWQGEILMLSDEPYLPYQRPPLSKAYLNGSVDAEALTLKRSALYEKSAVQIRLNCRVSQIDRRTKTIKLEDGDLVEYDQLILATGARARTIPMPGSDSPKVHYLRTLNDVTAIRSQLFEGAKLVVIGAGYIGLELAASARKMGVDVTVLEMLDRVLARVTCPEISHFFQELHRRNGVTVRLGSGVTQLCDKDHQLCATLTDGTELMADCVVIGIGVIPNSELAAEAGLHCDNGVLVNEFAQSSDVDIYAIGDVSNHPNPHYHMRLRLESVPNALEQAKVAAANICGVPTLYQALPWFWSDQYTVKLQTVGILTGYDQTVLRGDMDSEKFALFYLKGGELLAVDAVNSPVDFMQARRVIPLRVRPSLTSLADTSQVWWEKLSSKA